MATTVHSLNYKLLVDSSDFEKGMSASKKELRDAKKVMRETITPMERYENEVHKIDKLLKAGVISQDMYNRKVRMLNTDLRAVTKTTKGFTKTFSGLQAAFAVGLAAISAGAIGRGISNEINRIDQLAKKARAIGASVEFLSGLEFVTQQVSGFQEGQATKALTKMVQRIANGSSEAIKALDQLGLSQKALVQSSPAEQFRQISRAMDGIANEGERSALALKLFDDEQANIHTTMALITAEYDKQIQLGKQLNKVITDGQSARAEEAKQAISEFTAALDGLKTEAAIVATPAIGDMAAVMRASREVSQSRNDNFEGNDLLFGSFNISRRWRALGRNLMAARGLPIPTMSDSDQTRIFQRKRAEQEKAELDNRKAVSDQFKASQEPGAAFVGRGIKAFFESKAEQETEANIAMWGKFWQGVGSRIVDDVKDPLNPLLFKQDKPDDSAAVIKPLESLAAGTSEEFRFRYTDQQTKAKEMALVKTQTTNSTKSVAILDQILTAVGDTVGVNL